MYLVKSNVASFPGRSLLVLVIFYLTSMGFIFGTDLSTADSTILGKASNMRVISEENLHNIQVVADKIIVQSLDGEKKKISVIDSESLSQLWSTVLACDFYNVSLGDNAAIVLEDVIEEGTIDIVAYSLSGDLLFSKKWFYEGEIFPSPNGQYFFTGRSQLSNNRFIVFDRSGNELFSFPRGQGGWHTAAFNDTVVAYFVDEEIRFLALPTGRSIKSIRMADPSGSKRLPTTPAVRIARNGSHMLVCWRGQEVYITPTLEIGWKKDCQTAFRNAAFSEDSRFVAVYEAKGHEYSLTLVSCNTGNVLWSEKVATNRSEGRSRHHDLAISGEFVRLFVPQAYYLAAGLLSVNTRTIIAHFDPNDGKLTGYDEVKGIVFVQRVDDGYRTLSVTIEQADNITLKEWEHEGSR